MSIEGGSGIGMGGGSAMSSGGGVATAAPAISAPSMGGGGERGFAPISISNAKGEVTLGKTEHTFTFGKPTPNHLGYAAVTKGFEAKAPTKGNKGSVNTESAMPSQPFAETSSSQQPAIEPLTEESKTQLHDDIAAFLKGGKTGETTSPQQATETSIADSPKAEAGLLDTLTQATNHLESQHQSPLQERPKSSISGRTEGQTDQPVIKSEKVAQTFEQVANHAEKPKGEKAAETARAVSKEQKAGTEKSAHQDLKHELTSKYVQKFFDASQPGSESQRQLIVEQLLHKEKADAETNDGKLMRDINTVAEEWDKNLDKAVTVAEAYFAYLQSVQQDSPEKRKEGINLAISALTEANQRTGVEKGAEKVIEMKIAAEATMVAEDDEEEEEVQEQTKRKQQVGTVTLTDAEEQTATKEALTQELEAPQPLPKQTFNEVDTEIVEVYTEDDKTTEITTTLEDDMLVQKVVEVEEVVDTQTNEVRAESGILAAEASLIEGEGVTSGNLLTQIMPDKHNQPEEMTSQIIRDNEVHAKIDGSYVGMIDQINRAGEIRSIQQAEHVIFQAIADNTAVKRERSERISERPASDAEVWKVLNSNFATSRNAA